MDLTAGLDYFSACSYEKEEISFDPKSDINSKMEESSAFSIDGSVSPSFLAERDFQVG